ncbi:rab-GTPase-TBC domain-containing protein [Flagelloscypha sp. PMI_526]|nr:rab-GTPase-TBC domain-containing protein [Flagelloscypha sp. PMI_526]
MSTTPANSHPLLLDESPTTSRTRKGRYSAGNGTANVSPLPAEGGGTNNYLARKAALDNDIRVNGGSDGSLRLLSRTNSRSSQSLTALFEREHEQTTAPLFIVRNSPEERKALGLSGPKPQQGGDSLVSRVLSHDWHDYSDDAIQTTVSHLETNLPHSTPQSTSPYHPYMSAIRILSSKLVKATVELEETRRLLREFSSQRKAQAESVVASLPSSSEREIATKVLNAFLDGDMSVTSPSYSLLQESLEEALEDEVDLPKSLPADETFTQELVNRADASTPTPEPDYSLQLAFPSKHRSDSSSIISQDTTTSSVLTTNSQPRRPKTSMTEWMGSLWGRRDRVVSSSPSIIEQSEAPTAATDDADGEETAKPIRRPNINTNRKRSAKSVFGTLSISLLGSTAAALKDEKADDDGDASSIVITEDTTASDAASIKSTSTSTHQDVMYSSSLVNSLVSPIGGSFSVPPTPIAPQLSFDSDASMTIPTESIAEEPPSMAEMKQGSSLRAICNATRVLPNVLSFPDETGQLIAQLALELVQNARDEGLTFRDRPLRVKASGDISGRSTMKDSEKGQDVTTPTAASVFGAETAAMTLNRTLEQGTKKKSRHRASASSASAAILPALALPVGAVAPLFNTFSKGHRSTSSASISTSAKDAVSPINPVNPTSIIGSMKSAMGIRPAGSVAMESIIPDSSKPPTQYLNFSSSTKPNRTHNRNNSSKSYTPLLSANFHFTMPDAPSMSTTMEDSALSDRYGFVYSVSQYDVLLLYRAKECGCTAPACLTGVRIADREEDGKWPDSEDGPADGRKGEEMNVVIGECTCDGSGAPLPSSGENNNSTPLLAPTGGSGDSDDADTKSIISTKSADTTPAGSIKKRNRVSLVPSLYSAPPLAPSASTSVLVPSSTTPRHGCVRVVRHFLDDLQSLHEERQSARRKDWDTFVRSRQANIGSTSKSSGLSSKQGTLKVSSTTSAAAAFLGLGSKGIDLELNEEEELGHTDGLLGFGQLATSGSERKELDKLLRAGIPLAYRAKVWVECSGALDLREPGAFNDLLNEPTGPREGYDGSLDAVDVEIEKDVGRTMPLNMFFGGQGKGVDKLRRVLRAYSRRNPAVGYCQGMNLITSTLLLVHADEEEAFYVLCSIVEKLLPEEFFSPVLLSSRACPLVLMEYVKDMTPKLHAHLESLGVDLPAICFSWFLSLFTDCLPVETLFRVWDIFLVDGLDVLFRVAFAILKNNEAELLRCESIPAVYVAMESLPTRMWEVDKLLQTEQELRSTMHHADLVNKRNAHVAQLQELMNSS